MGTRINQERSPFGIVKRDESTSAKKLNALPLLSLIPLIGVVFAALHLKQTFGYSQAKTFGNTPESKNRSNWHKAHGFLAISQIGIPVLAAIHAGHAVGSALKSAASWIRGTGSDLTVTRSTQKLNSVTSPVEENPVYNGY